VSAARRDGDDVVLSCHLQPRASRDEWVGLHGDALKLRIQAPPVDGAANKALVKFLAAEFGVPRQQVIIEQGDSSRRKRVRIQAPATLPPAVAEQLDH
jgi:hypothetical protein